MSLNTFLFLAQTEGGGGGGAGNPGSMIPFFLIMLAMMYFVMIRPQQKKAKETRAMLAAMKIGDKVVTLGGVHGLITNLGETTATVKVDDGVKIRFEKASIAKVIPGNRDKDSGSEEEADSESTAEEEEEEAAKA